MNKYETIDINVNFIIILVFVRVRMAQQRNHRYNTASSCFGDDCS